MDAQAQINAVVNAGNALSANIALKTNLH